jgi:hypothetical protein
MSLSGMGVLSFDQFTLGLSERVTFVMLSTSLSCALVRHEPLSRWGLLGATGG